MFNKKRLINTGSSILLLLLLATTAYGINSLREGYRIVKGAQGTKVTVQNTCKTISCSGGQDIFIPTNSSLEWDTFLANKPSYVAVGGCASLPTAPQNLTGTIGNQQTTLNWDAPADNGGEEVTYNVYRSEGSNSSYIKTLSDSNRTSYTNSGLTSGVVYYYKVSASNSAGEGPQSSEFKTSQYMGNQIDCVRGTTSSFIGPYSTKDAAVRATISSLESCLVRNNYVTPVTLTYYTYNQCGTSRGSCRKVSIQTGGFGLSNPECTYSTSPRSWSIAHPYKTWTYINSNQIVKNQSTNALTGTAKEYSYGDLSMYDKASSNRGDGCSGGIYPESITFNTTICNGQTSISYCLKTENIIPTSVLK